MIIGIDGNEANTENKVGIGQYAFNLLTNLSRISDDKYIIYLKNKPGPEMPVRTDNWQYKVFGPKFMWTRIGLPLNLFLGSDKPDIFFSPSHYTPGWVNCRTVFSIMDLSFIFFPELFRKKDLYQLTSWTEKSVKKASRIMTISKFSKQSIVKHYNLDPQKVVVTYPGYDKERFNETIINPELSGKIRKKFGISGDFILFVGTLQPRKNLVRLIEAFEEVLKQYPSMKLVIIGKKGWLYEKIFERAGKLLSDGKIIFANYVNDNELPYFYHTATCFVLPSLFEGFGIPVLEAMASGCPVVVSNTSSLPEIADGCGLLVNPENYMDIARAILKLCSDRRLKAELIRKGLENSKMFSWEKCTEDTLKVIKEIGKNSILV